ncbi:MFS general substrate transporter [Clavulina sp. PMI_390]|nr:MFS general substrate transporter [Clavulina sp. PMI_390]
MSSDPNAHDTKPVNEKPSDGIDINESLSSDDKARFDSAWTPEAERKLLWKIDLALVPWLTLLYLLSCLDRVSIGSASLYGLAANLHMTNQQYLWALTLFFFSYGVFEVPSNILLKRLSPRIWLSTIMVIWGIVMTTQGLVHNAGGLMTARFFLGVAEAGLFPGVLYYLSCWYKRAEVGRRMAIFWSSATAAVAFGGLLAAAISNMHGIGGKPAWAWIFILEGLLTVVVGFASFWVIQNFPEDAKILTDEERKFVIRRLQEDAQFSAGGEKLNKKHVWAAVTDWKTWLGMLCFAGGLCPVYAIALFLPSIIHELGYRATPANLMGVPAVFTGTITTISVGFLSDRYGRRGWWNVGSCIVGITGYIILLASNTKGVTYFGVFVASAGICPLIRMAWMSNNIEGTHKRSVSIAMIGRFGTLNGAVASNIYRAKNAPWYRMGHAISLAYVAMTLITSLLFIYFLDRENKARDAGLRDELILSEHSSEKGEDDRSFAGGTYETVDEARREKGDCWSGYRYVL